MALIVLSVILAYVMQGCILPARVLNNLDKFNQNFVWGLTDEKKKMHMVNWKTITRPKRRGGLGIQEARGRNLNLAAKLCWRMENSKNGGQAEVLGKKYILGSARKNKAHTRTWNDVNKGRDICVKGSKWIVGCNSSLSFQNDKWLNIGTMRSLIEGPLNRGESEVHLKEVITNNGQDLANFSFVFPNPILKAVMATPLRRQATREDHKSWISSLNGEFDPKNTYLLAVDENLEAPDFHGKRIWKLQTLPKIQFFLWKCLHPSLLVKSILAQRLLVWVVVTTAQLLRRALFISCGTAQQQNHFGKVQATLIPSNSPSLEILRI